jgi:anti-repressor protein
MELQIFNNEEFGEIRTITKDDEPMFCLGDLCKALDLTAKGVKQRLSDEVISNYPIEDSLGRMQNTLFVNEDGLYDVILESRKECARKFRKWVTSEVLPSIRKNGGYIAGQETLSDEELMAKALLVANNKIAERDKIIEQKQARIEQMKPKEIFADAVATSHTSILVGDLAKLICQNGYQIGQKRLFDWLRANGYLIKRKGAEWNMPTQKSIEMGLFERKALT